MTTTTLLGRHVKRRAHDRADARQRGALRRSRDVRGVSSFAMCFLIEEQRPVIICMLRVIQQRIRQRILKNCTDALAFYFEMLCKIY